MHSRPFPLFLPFGHSYNVADLPDKLPFHSLKQGEEERRREEAKSLLWKLKVARRVDG